MGFGATWDTSQYPQGEAGTSVAAAATTVFSLVDTRGMRYMHVRVDCDNVHDVNVYGKAGGTIPTARTGMAIIPALSVDNHAASTDEGYWTVIPVGGMRWVDIAVKNEGVDASTITVECVCFDA